LEIHFGAEYIFLVESMPVAVRAGAYLDPDHDIRYTGDSLFYKLVFPEGDDEIHVTFGCGFVPVENFQIDFAGNVAEDTLEVIVSTVYRF